MTGFEGMPVPIASEFEAALCPGVSTVPAAKFNAASPVVILTEYVLTVPPAAPQVTLVVGVNVVKRTTPLTTSEEAKTFSVLERTMYQPVVTAPVPRSEE